MKMAEFMVAFFAGVFVDWHVFFWIDWMFWIFWKFWIGNELQFALGFWL